MKNKILLAFALICIFLLPFGVFAQDNVTVEQTDVEPEDITEVDTVDVEEEIDLPDPGITPDSFLWGMDVALDDLGVALSGDAEAQAEAGLEVAQERLAEMEEMADEDNAEAVEKAQEEHEETITEVEEDIEEIEDEEKIVGIQQGMANHVAAMEKVMAKVQANENIPEATREKLVNKFQNKIANAEELKTKILDKKAEIALKKEEKLALKGGEETESEDEVEDEDESEDLNETESNDKSKGKNKNNADSEITGDAVTDTDAEEADDSADDSTDDVLH